MSRTIALLWPCVASGLIVATHAFGQSAAPAGEERVVVSATRSEQKPFDVPAAIDSVT